VNLFTQKIPTSPEVTVEWSLFFAALFAIDVIDLLVPANKAISLERKGSKIFPRYAF
jgi:hypothetical protein